VVLEVLVVGLKAYFVWDSDQRLKSESCKMSATSKGNRQPTRREERTESEQREQTRKERKKEKDQSRKTERAQA
jgi:hypothetical protein